MNGNPNGDGLATKGTKDTKETEENKTMTQDEIDQQIRLAALTALILENPTLAQEHPIRLAEMVESIVARLRNARKRYAAEARAKPNAFPAPTAPPNRDE